MTGALLAGKEAARTPWRIVLALAATQMIGWGTTYYLPAILARSIVADTGLSNEAVFAGVTVMVLVSAVLAPWAGRRLDRDGARPWMTAGSGLAALGLALLSLAEGPVLYALAWAVIGCAAPLALTQAASTALVQIAPGRARRTIALLLLFSGLSSTASWPLLAWLDATVGWRASLVLFAGLHALVCLPLHAAALPRGRGALDDPAPRGGAALPPVAPVRVRGAFWLTATAFSCAGFVTWGLPLHVVALLREDGYGEAAAVAVGALIGPAQVLARVIELAGGERVDILVVGVAATLVLPFTLLVGLLAPASTAAAVALCVGYGVAAGAMTIVRAVAPLRLFGREAYAVALGRLAVPQNVAFAAAPTIFAAVRSSLGGGAMLLLAAAVSAPACLALLVLARRVARAEER